LGAEKTKRIGKKKFFVLVTAER